MIFVTVGAQMPFDRLVSTVDQWAARAGRTDVFAQIGAGGRQPKHIGWSEFVEPADFRRRVSTSDAIVAHAGMGSILTALEFGKPILVMPRRGDLRETRNDHQVATAERLRELGRVAVAMDEGALAQQLDGLSDLAPSAKISPHASGELITVLREFIREGASHRT